MCKCADSIISYEYTILLYNNYDRPNIIYDYQAEIHGTGNRSEVVL